MSGTVVALEDPHAFRLTKRANARDDFYRVMVEKYGQENAASIKALAADVRSLWRRGIGLMIKDVTAAVRRH